MWRDGLVQPIDHAHREDGVEIFGAPVLFGRRLGRRDRARARHRRRGSRSRALCRSARIGGNMGLGDGAVDQQASRPRRRSPVRRILAFSTILRAFSEIGLGVDIDVADAFEMRDHRHTALALHPLDQRARRRAARSRRCASAMPSIMPTAARSRGRHKLDRRLGQAGRLRARRRRRQRSPARNGSSPSRRAGWRHCRL